MQQIDLVTVAFGEDLGLLRVQARALARFLPADITASIIVIGNDPDPVWFEAVFHRTVLPLYGPLAGKVVYADRSSMGLRRLKRKGYGAQQTLKLMAARLAKSDHMLVLDAKAHPLKPVQWADMIAPDGRAYLIRYPLNPKFGPKLQASYDYFTDNAGPVPADPERAFPMTIPLMLITAEVRAMMDHIEAKSGLPFEWAFGSVIRANEFYLYGAWLYANPGRLERYYTDGPMPAFILYAQLQDHTLESLKVMSEGELARWFTVHRTLIATRHPELLRLVEKVWRRAGFDDVLEQVMAENKVPNWLARKLFLLRS